MVTLSVFVVAACLTTVLCVTPDLILLDHNKARSDKGVGPLSYNNTIGTAAQSYSTVCQFKHSGNPLYGENIAAWAGSGGAPKQESDSGMRGWIDSEYPNWDCQTNTCTTGECGHYTQAVWAGSSQIGCGLTECTTGSPFGASFPTWYFYVCNYYPPGNYVGQRPFPTSGCNSVAPCSPDATCSTAGATCGTIADGCSGQTCGSACSGATTVTHATAATTAAVTHATTATTAAATVATTGPATHATTAAATVATTGPATHATTAAATVATTGSATHATTAAATVATTGPATHATTAAATVATTGPATHVTTSAATHSTTGHVSTGYHTSGGHPTCSAGASYSTSGRTTTITFGNSGNEALTSITLTISGTVTTTTGLARQSNGQYTVNAVPVAPAGQVTVSYTFSSSSSTWSFSISC